MPPSTNSGPKNSSPVDKKVARTTINAWEDAEFVKAVKASGRKKLIMTALWTEACAALERITQAGATPVSWVQLICELQRDWQRKETAKEFANILFAMEGH